MFLDRGSGIGSAGGYVGHGLTATNLAARTLRDLILDRNTETTRLPWVGRHARRWEIEPIRWIGATALYAAYRQGDRQEAGSSSDKTAAATRIANAIAGR